MTPWYRPSGPPALSATAMATWPDLHDTASMCNEDRITRVANADTTSPGTSLPTRRTVAACPASGWGLHRSCTNTDGIAVCPRCSKPVATRQDQRLGDWVRVVTWHLVVVEVAGWTPLPPLAAASGDAEQEAGAQR